MNERLENVSPVDTLFQGVNREVNVGLADSEKRPRTTIFPTEIFVYQQALDVLAEKARKDIGKVAVKAKICGCGQCENTYTNAVSWHYTDLKGNILG